MMLDENRDDKTIDIEDIPSSTGPDIDEIQDTPPYPSCFFWTVSYF
jgi:hypothetical protein